jgi:hypothetical protein
MPLLRPSYEHMLIIVSEDSHQVKITHFCCPSPSQAIQSGLGCCVRRDVDIPSLRVRGTDVDDSTAGGHVGNNVMDHEKSAKDIELEDLGQLVNVRLLSDGAEVRGSRIIDCR